MRVLLTNDDGVHSDGLSQLEARLREEHDVWVVAPEANRSGSAHSVTLGSSTRVRRLEERRFSCSGSPADCVLVAHLGIVPQPIDLVLSGINHGPNLGTDIIYSGTAAAARQGAFEGTPSVALSLYGYREPRDFAPAIRFTSDHLAEFVRVWEPNTFVNLNFPAASALKGLRVTSPCVRTYRDNLECRDEGEGVLVCTIGGELPTAEPDPGSDYQAVKEGFVSFSLVEIHPTSVAPRAAFSAKLDVAAAENF